jgi:hypothetical protein
MKRVERRGTLDNALLPTLPHHIAPHPPQPPPVTHTRSSQQHHSPSHQSSDRSVHRTDTIPAGQAVGPGGTQLLSFANRDPQQPSPSSFSRASVSGGGSGARRSPAHGSIRSQPSPPAIATLQPDSEDISVPGSSPEALTVPPASSRKNGHSKSGSRRGSRRPSPSRASSSSPLDTTTAAHAKHSERRPSSPQSIPSRGSGGKVTPPPAADDDADADGEPEPEAEAEADLDPNADDPLAEAEAELLEAVDAAEANSSESGSGWLKKEDS